MILGGWLNIRLRPWCDGVGMRFNDNRCELPCDTAGISCLCVGVGVANGGGSSFGCGVAAVAFGAVAFGVEASTPILPAKPALFEGEAESGVYVGCPVQSFPSSCGASRCLKPRPVASPLWLPLSLLLQ